MPRTPEGPPRDPAVGLCATCRHARVVRNRRGSAFYLCRRSETDPRYRKYPQLPVTRCAGFDESAALPDGGEG